MAQSMPNAGDSFDNAMAPSLWASLKKELVYRTDFSTREGPSSAIFDQDLRGTTGSVGTRASTIYRRFSSNKPLRYKLHR